MIRLEFKIKMFAKTLVNLTAYDNICNRLALIKSIIYTD